LERYVWALAAAWTIIVAGLLVWDVHRVRQVTRELATNEARAHFEKDQAFRLWATSHGGVYVPTDDRTPPNPYLSYVLERDIDTPSGQSLTLMNPHYMVRQMSQEFADLYGVAGHLTSLKPLRPENAPDSWERAALEAFEQGTTEVREFTEINGEPYLRHMQPMLTQSGCLNCHGHQGYQVGDVRGGVSVSVPLASFWNRERETITSHTLSLSLLWVLGLAVIGLGSHRLRLRIRERDQAAEALRKAHDLLDARVRARTAELSKANEALLAEISERVRAEEELKKHRDHLGELVTERTQELAQANERLQELDRLKSKFITDISHELRTPVTNIRLYLQLLERGKASKHAQYLAVSKKQTDRLIRLVEDILHFSQLELDKSKAKFVPMDLNKGVKQVVAAHRSRTELAGLELIFEPGANLPPVRAVPAQLTQVVGKLLDNAIGYTLAGRVRVSTGLDAEQG
jgi:signal transduction histidine kinase